MMKITEFEKYLKTQFPAIKFYSGEIKKKDRECVGLYPRGNITGRIALGGKENTSYSTLPVTLLIHWSESIDRCQDTSNILYEHLLGLCNFYIGDRRIISVDMVDSEPIGLSKDENNIYETSIRININYER